MELSKPKRIIKSFYDATSWKPDTLASTIQFFFDLNSLSKEELGSEANEVEKITNTIKGFGLKKETIQKAKGWEFTTKQWKRLRDTIKKHYPNIEEWQVDPQPNDHSEIDLEKVPLPSIGKTTILTQHPPAKKKTFFLSHFNKKYIAPHDPSDGPEKFLKYRVDLTKLPREAVAILTSLIDAIGRSDMISSVTVPILDYFTFVKILSEDRPDLPVLLEPIEKVLEGHGWTTGGFLSPPDRLLLLEDLHAIVDRGLDSYRKFKIEPPKPVPKEESLASSLISDLIRSLEPTTADGTIREFLEMVEIIANSSKEFSEMMNSVRRLLKTRGWIGDRFDQSPDCETLKRELLEVLV